MKKKVLSIDFDIIMSPSINFYNNMVGGDLSLSDIVNDYSFLDRHLPADLYQYEYLTRIIAKQLKEKSEFYFISNHKSVSEILKNDTDIDFTNMDHHHDIGYEIKNWNLPIINCDCGNWVKWCRDKNIISNYIWVCNDNSDEPEDAAKKKYLNKKITFKDFSMKPIDKYDIVIICASWEWIPPEYEPLFMSWIGMCEEVLGKNFQIDNF